MPEDRYQTAIFDFRNNSKVISPVQIAVKNSILIMEGVFLFRSELVNYWDLKIFIDIDFKIALERALKRNTERTFIGNKNKIQEKYEKRYIPAQQIYFENINPKEKANIIINNNDFKNPIITKG